MSSGNGHVLAKDLEQKVTQREWLLEIILEIEEEKSFCELTLKFENGKITLAERRQKKKPPQFG